MFIQNAHPYVIMAIGIILVLLGLYKAYKWIRSHTAKGIFMACALIYGIACIVGGLVCLVMWVWG